MPRASEASSTPDADGKCTCKWVEIFGALQCAGATKLNSLFQTFGITAYGACRHGMTRACGEQRRILSVPKPVQYLRVCRQYA